MFEKFLEELGLSEKEAKIYIALLQVDRGTIHDLADKTKINRTTVYPVLESLGKKGLVSEVQEGKKTSYQAASPERLETYVERQKVVLEEQAERLKDLIPQMKSIQREQGEKPIIKLFQGREGAIAAYKEFYSFPATANKDGYYFINSDLLAEVFTEEEMTKFRELRKGKKITSNIVYNRNSGDKIFEKNRAAFRLDSEESPIGIIDDMVVISTLGKSVNSILIKSKDLSETLSSLVKYICNTRE
jgi:sugar-specific transcriptional regulator TrmB